jgi:predicted  nucleic acid-binding Zn-ribbon protein
MIEDRGMYAGCTEEFTELCALATTESLAPDERARLELHLRVCESCAQLLAGYRRLAGEGMAYIGSELLAAKTTEVADLRWNRARARARLLGAMEWPAPSPVFQSAVQSSRSGRRERFMEFVSRPRTLELIRLAAVVVLTTLVAYQFGIRMGALRQEAQRAGNSLEHSLTRQLADVQSQRVALNRKLAAGQAEISSLEQRATRVEQELKKLQAERDSLEARSNRLGAQNQQQSSSLAELAGEREALQRRVQDAEAALQSARADLTASQEERQRALLHGGSLETQIESLKAQLRERQATTDRQEQFLASNRDIRELMGARQLYIADVFDVDPRGNTRKPFGRVFYTQGKSLIFYAFDLDQQPGFRDAKTVQAWGRQGATLSTPVSLGIFYMDNESNRRWALKFDNPKVLEEINAVFVTLEPKGGSKKPTNKPFLLAYLHTAPPNHP